MATGRGDEPQSEHGGEDWEEEPPRSILSARWFRVLVVVLVVGGVAAIAVPYVMDMTAPSMSRHVVVPAKPVTKPAEKALAPAVAPSPAPAPAPAPPAALAGSAVASTPVIPAKPEPKPEPKSAVVAPASKPAEPQKIQTSKPGTRIAQATKPEPVKPEATKPEPSKAEPAKPDAAKPEKPSAMPAKPETQKSESVKSAPTRPATTKSRRTAKSAATAAAKGEGSAFWVQVGAFRDPTTANKLAASLKERGFQVAESTMVSGTASATKGAPAKSAPPDSAADRYDVLVSSSTPSDAAQKLTAKGLSAETVTGGAVVRPSLPLRDAIALANDLRADGLKVAVKRVSDAAAKPAPAAAASAGETLHRVRVGAFADRAAARAAAEKLEALGYKPFIARGSE